jgi:hypothetical protein
VNNFYKPWLWNNFCLLSLLSPGFQRNEVTSSFSSRNVRSPDMINMQEASVHIYRQKLDNSQQNLRQLFFFLYTNCLKVEGKFVYICNSVCSIFGVMRAASFSGCL